MRRGLDGASLVIAGRSCGKDAGGLRGSCLLDSIRVSIGDFGRPYNLSRGALHQHGEKRARITAAHDEPVQAPQRTTPVEGSPADDESPSSP